MKRCAICSHRVHVPGKCMGRTNMAIMGHGYLCPCQGPKAAEIPIEVARELLARKARNRASKKQGDDWEQEIIKKAKAEGYLVHHVRPAKTAKGWRSPISGDKGFPDICLAHPMRPDIIFAETKTGDAKLTNEQDEWRGAILYARADARNVLSYYVWHPRDREAIYRRLEGKAA